MRRLYWVVAPNASNVPIAKQHNVATHDPAFLDLYKRCLAEIDRERKMQMYAQLASLTTAPMGGF